MITSLDKIDNTRLMELLDIPLEKIAELPLDEIIALSTVQINDQEEKFKNKMEVEKLKRNLTFAEKLRLSEINTLHEKTKLYRRTASIILGNLDTVKTNSGLVSKTLVIVSSKDNTPKTVTKKNKFI